MNNLADIHIVDSQACFLIPFPLLGRHQGCIELLAVKLLAFDSQIGLCINWVAQLSIS